MRVLITGANGQVGRELLRFAPSQFDTVGMSSYELDITDHARMMHIIERVRPHLIINAAAYTAVDKAESEPERAYAVNRDGVANLATQATRLNIPLLHISTDYVFAGDGDEPYRESDATEPTGVYGATKLAGERALTRACPHHIILRTSWVFGQYGTNFVKTMLRLGGERNELAVVADQYGAPTSAASIARALWTLARQYHAEGSLVWGIYHFSGTPACSWYDFSLEIFDQAQVIGLLAHAPTVKPIGTAQYPTQAKRPAWSVLNCEQLQQTYGITPEDWRVELKAMLTQLRDRTEDT